MDITKLIRRHMLPFALLLAGAAWAQTSDMPLGNVVKQPKAAKKAARVITDDDLPPRPPAAVPDSDAAGQADEDVDAKTKSAPSTGPKNQLVAQRIADLKDAESAEEQLIRKIEQKLSDDSEPLSAPQRQSYANALKQSRTTLDSYQQQRTTLEDVAAKPESEDEEKAADKAPQTRPQAGKSPASTPEAAPQEAQKAAD